MPSAHLFVISLTRSVRSCYFSRTFLSAQEATRDCRFLIFGSAYPGSVLLKSAGLFYLPCHCEERSDVAIRFFFRPKGRFFYCLCRILTGFSALGIMFLLFPVREDRAKESGPRGWAPVPAPKAANILAARKNPRTAAANVLGCTGQAEKCLRHFLP